MGLPIQSILTYFVRVSVIVQLTSSLYLCFEFSCIATKTFATDEFNPVKQEVSGTVILTLQRGLTRQQLMLVPNIWEASKIKKFGGKLWIRFRRLLCEWVERVLQKVSSIPNAKLHIQWGRPRALALCLKSCSNVLQFSEKQIFYLKNSAKNLEKVKWHDVIGSFLRCHSLRKSLSISQPRANTNKWRVVPR